LITAGKTMAGLSSAERDIRRSANSELANLALRQLASSDALRALTGQRELKGKFLETALGFEDKRIERYLGLEKEFRQETSALAKEERQAVRDGLVRAVDMGLKYGVSFDQLSPEDQVKIATSAAQTPGMSLDLIVESMKRGQMVFQEERNKVAADIARVNRAGTRTTGTLSSRTEQVLSGFTRLSDLSIAERTRVRDELFARGFGDATPPTWFKEFVSQELQMTLLPEELSKEWETYRKSIMDTSKKESSDDLFDSLGSDEEIDNI